ncbi:putative transcriptional regulatory [Hyphodiscus hymeniophilus]|uniref:Transcriptional regulatory n=1 Tax=Hyphodiscus hymeniophilus TaxID=353542 RepID=A0A9P7AY55_9HELO|nr:putative transcriptional regulatory [Hyphodiscus hymeniophilus]
MNNLLESQVTDLASLASSPILLSDNMNDRRQSSSAESPADTGNGSGNKRKGEDTNGTSHTRAKRNRYISIAWYVLDLLTRLAKSGLKQITCAHLNDVYVYAIFTDMFPSNECKRRKIKCNGNNPCQRCGNQNLECQYAPNCCTNSFQESDEFRQMITHIASLQEQVDNLYASLNALRNGDGMFTSNSERSMSVSQPPANHPISPMSRYRPQPIHSSFRGPSSSAFSLNVAKNTLQNMGYQGLGVDEGMNSQDPTPAGSPPGIQPPPLVNLNGNPCRDPIWTFSKEEMVRLCRVYEEEVGIMYPVLNIEQLIVHGTNLYRFIDAALRTGLANTTRPGQGVSDEQSCILKLVLACATLVEGSGQSEIAYRLFESVREAADRTLHSEVIELKSLPFLVLVANYHFHCDEEALAWRIIGQVARMCIELGLHRRDSLFKVVSDPQERADVIKLFWSIYVLDRRWSFGTGMPFAIQDADIDPTLPEPLSIPYLNVMISYSRIGSKVWRSISSFAPASTPSLNIEEIGYLDYQILQWRKSIPDELQLPLASSPQTDSRTIHRLQVLLYLRANQMRIHIYRPVLHTASSIQENLNYANNVVELAKDTIRSLTHLNQTTDIYRAQQVCFNYFLISALAVIFLASCHAPVHFSALCRSEFYMALDLVKGFSNKSFVSKRLWRTIKGLKEVGPKLGLSEDSNNIGPEDPHSSAALVMAGLAGHEISGLEGVFGQDGNVNGLNGGSGKSPMDGFQMSNEMTNLFEAALGSVGMNGNGYVPLQDGDLSGVGSNVFGGDEELYRQMRDLF